MEISSVVKTSAAEEQSATMFVALELSKKRWLIAVHSPIADKISYHGGAGGDTAALLACSRPLAGRRSLAATATRRRSA
jgi:transposase